MNDIDHIQQPVILFDGVCNLCSSFVQFVIKRDKKNIFKFASLQSDFSLSILKKFKLPTNTFNSFIFIKTVKFILNLQVLNGGKTTFRFMVAAVYFHNCTTLFKKLGVRYYCKKQV